MKSSSLPNPLSLAIQNEEIPVKVKVPKREYNDTTDSMDHWTHFSINMNLYNVSDAVKCKAFPIKFQGVAANQYNALPLASITSWDQMVDLFLAQFTSSSKQLISMRRLFAVRQGQNETLRAYIARFKTELGFLPLKQLMHKRHFCPSS